MHKIDIKSPSYRLLSRSYRWIFHYIIFHILYKIFYVIHFYGSKLSAEIVFLILYTLIELDCLRHLKRDVSINHVYIIFFVK